METERLAFSDHRIFWSCRGRNQARALKSGVEERRGEKWDYLQARTAPPGIIRMRRKRARRIEAPRRLRSMIIEVGEEPVTRLMFERS